MPQELHVLLYNLLACRRHQSAGCDRPTVTRAHRAQIIGPSGVLTDM